MINSPYLTQLDCEGMGMMERKQLNAIKNQLVDHALREQASKRHGHGMGELRSGASSSSSSSRGRGSYYESVPDSSERGAWTPKPHESSGYDIKRPW